MTLLVFILILGVLIFVHEAGHFVVSKISGVGVREFGFGFPPRLISKKIGETRYSINLIPLGGYVRLLGEESASRSPRSYFRKPVRIKLAIIAAGVIMNFLLAWLLLTLGFLIGMSPLATDPAILGGRQSAQVMIAGTEEDSPASRGGLTAGDIITDFGSVDQLREFTSTHQGEKVTLTVLRGGEQSRQEFILSSNEAAPLGVAVVTLSTVKLSLWGAMQAASNEMIGISQLMFDFLGGFIKTLFTSGRISEGVGGPIAIYQGTGEAIKLGWIYVLQLTALLSINLGFINVLPFPALDGGRLVLLGLEGVIRQRILRLEIENILHLAGFALLILLMLAVTVREVRLLF